MKKTLKTLIVGLGAITVFSAPAYANDYTSIKKDITELRETVIKINGGDVSKNASFEDENYTYNVYFASDHRLDFTVTNKESRKEFQFKDDDSKAEWNSGYWQTADGILDSYSGSLYKPFTKNTTPTDKWEKLEEKYHMFIKRVLPIAKKDLKEKYSSLDKDLEDMQSCLK